MPEEGRLFWVDAFASNPFAGNPAAVCLTTEELPDNVKQAIACGLNLSETVFIQPQADSYTIRWFTPTREVPLVGHATLAAAHIVLERLEPQRNAVTFLSLASGPLAAYRVSNGLAIELPADETQECSPPPDLITGLGAEPASARVGRHYVELLESETAVARLKPDFQALRGSIAHNLATAPGNRDDYVLRFLLLQMVCRKTRSLVWRNALSFLTGAIGSARAASSPLSSLSGAAA